MNVTDARLQWFDLREILCDLIKVEVLSSCDFSIDKFEWIRQMIDAIIIKGSCITHNRLISDHCLPYVIYHCRTKTITRKFTMACFIEIPMDVLKWGACCDVVKCITALALG